MHASVREEGVDYVFKPLKEFCPLWGIIIDRSPVVAHRQGEALP